MAGIKKAGEAADKGLKALIGGVTAAATAGYSEDAEAKGVIALLMEAPNLISKGYLKPEHITNKTMAGKARNAYMRDFQNNPEFRKSEIVSLSNTNTNPHTVELNEFDDRFYTDKRNSEIEKAKLKGTQVDYSESKLIDAPEVSIEDYEGMPFITSMADRTEAGKSIIGINGTIYDQAIDLLGGQNYMFDPKNIDQMRIWASDSGPVKQMLAKATELRMKYGKDPLLLPFRMSPSSNDHAHMVTEIMLKQARQTLSSADKKKLNKQIREILPKYKGVEDLESIAQLGDMSGSQRKLLNQILDRDYRDKTGVSLPVARLAVTEQAQLNAKDIRLQNVGQIDTNIGTVGSGGNPTYGEGIGGFHRGVLKEKDISPLELLPDFMQQRGLTDPLAPLDPTEAYTLRSYPVKGGVITEDMIRTIVDRHNQGGYVDPKLLSGVVAAGFGSMLLAPQDAEAGFIGPKAVTWSKDAAAKAQELLDKGVDPEAVRKITGIIYNRPTHVGSEGNLRQEISDKGSKFVGQRQPTAEETKQLKADKKTVKKLKDLTDYMMEGFSNKTLSVSDLEKIRGGDEYKDLIEEHLAAKDRIDLHKFKYQPQVNQGPLGGFLNAPMLENYPDLARYDTTYSPNATDSWFRGSTKQISVGGQKQEGIDDTGKALHEVQHAVQSIEGNQGGGSVDQFMPSAQQEYDAISNEISSLNDMMKKNVEYRDSLKEQGGNDEAIADLKDAYAELMGDKIVLVSKINNKDAREIAFDKYLALPGEREARATAERKDMDIMERVKNKPSNLASVAAGSAVAGGALYTPDDNQAEASPLTYSSIFDQQQDAPLPAEDDSPVSYSGIFSSPAESDVNPPVQLTPEQPVMQQQPSYIDQNIAQLRDTFAQRRIAKGGTIRKQNQINAMTQEELNAKFGQNNDALTGGVFKAADAITGQMPGTTSGIIRDAASDVYNAAKADPAGEALNYAQDAADMIGYIPSLGIMSTSDIVSGLGKAGAAATGNLDPYMKNVHPYVEQAGESKSALLKLIDRGSDKIMEKTINTVVPAAIDGYETLKDYASGIPLSGMIYGLR